MSEPKQITELVVYRDLWVRGNKNGEDTALLNAYGMCCLGFGCMAAGVAAAEMHDIAEPGDLNGNEDDVLGFAEWDDGSFGSTPLSIGAMGVNDDGDIDDTEREACLIELFSDNGIALRFEDTAPKSMRDDYWEALPGA